MCKSNAWDQKNRQARRGFGALTTLYILAALATSLPLASPVDPAPEPTVVNNFSTTNSRLVSVEPVRARLVKTEPVRARRVSVESITNVQEASPGQRSVVAAKTMRASKKTQGRKTQNRKTLASWWRFQMSALSGPGPDLDDDSALMELAARKQGWSPEAERPEAERREERRGEGKAKTAAPVRIAAPEVAEPATRTGQAIVDSDWLRLQAGVGKTRPVLKMARQDYTAFKALLPPLARLDPAEQGGANKLRRRALKRSEKVDFAATADLLPMRTKGGRTKGGRTKDGRTKDGRTKNGPKVDKPLDPGKGMPPVDALKLLTQVMAADELARLAAKSREAEQKRSRPAAKTALESVAPKSTSGRKSASIKAVSPATRSFSKKRQASVSGLAPRHCLADAIAGWSGEELLDRHKKYLARKEENSRKLSLPLAFRLAAKGFEPGAPVHMRLFKDSSTLEVWLEKKGRFELYHSYQICRWSGTYGPKLFEGDRQSPEGFYEVDERLFTRPSWKWKNSFSIGFPNAYDKLHGRSGSLILVHGGCTSSGCFAMSDPIINEVHELAQLARDNGQQVFRINVYPFPLTNANMKKHANSPWMPFWRNLKQGYDLFETARRPATVRVCDKRYVFNTPQPEEANADQKCYGLAAHIPGWRPSPRYAGVIRQLRHRRLLHARGQGAIAGEEGSQAIAEVDPQRLAQQKRLQRVRVLRRKLAANRRKAKEKERRKARLIAKKARQKAGARKRDLAEKARLAARRKARRRATMKKARAIGKRARKKAGNRKKTTTMQSSSPRRSDWKPYSVFRQ